MTSDLPPRPVTAPAPAAPAAVTGRRVRANLREAFRVEVEVRDGRFSFVSDQGPEDGGGDAGPVPSEFLFSSLASCFAMAMAWSALKRRVTLPPDLEVIVSWGYNKPERMYDDIRIEARSSLATTAPEQFEALVRLAEQVCWVTRTIQRGRPIAVQAAARE